jgi:hypothetical protein
LRFSQIWLSPLVDACQPTYLTNLKKEKHWLACSPSDYSWDFSAISRDGFGYSGFQGLLLHMSFISVNCVNPSFSSIYSSFITLNDMGPF